MPSQDVAAFSGACSAVYDCRLNPITSARNVISAVIFGPALRATAFLTSDCEITVAQSRKASPALKAPRTAFSSAFEKAGV